MRIRDIQILTEAVQDLDTGKRFYDQQQSGIGNYFWDSLLGTAGCMQRKGSGFFSEPFSL